MRLKLRNEVYYEGSESDYHAWVVAFDAFPAVLLPYYEADFRRIASKQRVHPVGLSWDEYFDDASQMSDAILLAVEEGRLQFPHPVREQRLGDGRWWVRDGELERSAVATEMNLATGTVVAGLVLVSVDRVQEILAQRRSSPIQNDRK